MKLGVIADDFTGATDIALTLAEGGLRVAQMNGIPTSPVPGLDAGVIALKSRTAPVEQAVAQSLAACDWLRAQGCEQIVFKVCSTFDSTPQGNIGPVLQALAAKLDARSVITCPAFPENGRSVYLGHLFVGERLLSESGMQNHPLTPMTDPDLRRVLAAQTILPVHHIAMPTVQAGPNAIMQALADRPGAVIVDAISNADLRSIGQAARGQRLLCGGSGIALGLPANFGATPGTPAWSPVIGPGVVLSGSCSVATREQVARFDGPRHEITAADAIEGLPIDALADWVIAQDRVPMVYSSADPDVVRAAQARFGTDRAAHAIEAAFSALAWALAQRGVTRFVVAGGETSGAVVTGLGAQVLRIGPRIAPGVPVVASGGVALALKSGNFGGPAFFAQALAIMQAPS